MSDVTHEFVDLAIGQGLFKSRHLSFAVADGIVDALIGHVVVPFTTAEIARMRQASAHRFRPTVASMTLSALAVVSPGGVANR